MLNRRASDITRFACSGNITPTADGIVSVIGVPRNHFVKGVWLEVVTAFNAGTTVGTGKIGIASSDAWFFSTAAAAMGVVGMKHSGIGKYFTSGDEIIVTFAKNDSTTYPTIIVYAEFVPLYRGV